MLLVFYPQPSLRTDSGKWTLFWCPPAAPSSSYNAASQDDLGRSSELPEELERSLQSGFAPCPRSSRVFVHLARSVGSSVHSFEVCVHLYARLQTLSRCARAFLHQYALNMPGHPFCCDDRSLVAPWPT